MNLEQVQEAAKVIPVFVRNENEEVKPVKMTEGCMRCEHDASNLHTRGVYHTIVAFNEDFEGEWTDSLFGITVAGSDRSIRELSRYHWLPRMMTGAGGIYSDWISVSSIIDHPTLFVRLFNGFDGEGVQHKHHRVNVWDYIEDRVHEDQDILVWIFESFDRNPGFYVEPVEEMIDVRHWNEDMISRYAHSFERPAVSMKRILGEYWRIRTSKLVQMKSDTAPEVRDNRVNNRRVVVERLLREARIAEEQNRLIQAGTGRRPDVVEPDTVAVRWEVNN